MSRLLNSSAPRSFAILSICGLASIVFLAMLAKSATAETRPNILWISCEDISPNLGCYGDPHAITPQLDQLAKEGVRFERAFTPAGVCAVVRSSVITGMYAPSIGSQHMRSKIIPPANVQTLPLLLRKAGYFCTNRSKTDYQFDEVPTMWDRQGNGHADWRERSDPKQPFFSVVNITVCHESQIRHGQEKHDQVIQRIGRANRHDPDAVADTLPAYLPDTEATRKNWAWYHDNITLMDKMAGEVLTRLEEDGLSDNTLVVFWSDHGMGMPRGKRWIYDSGTLIPMIMRWPDRLDPDTVRPDLVNTVDLAPTMLAVAGVEVPRVMQGRVVIGKKISREPPYLFFHRDRMDEVYELQRGARDRRWKYIRNYEPDKPYSQRLDYMDEMPAMKDWRRLDAEGKLSGGQKNWFQVPKPIEELYDTENDPWEIENLADRPQYAQRLARMRQATEQWQEQIGDLGLVPEAVMMEEMKPGGVVPQVDPPTIDAANGELTLACPTEGAAMIYRLADNKNAPWRLYTKSFPDPGGAIEAQACRPGMKSSSILMFRSSDKP